MKIKLLLSLAVMALCSSAVWATPITVTGSSTDNIMIPDENINGVAETITFAGTGIQSVTDVQLTLNISQGFNGDYYAFLVHGSDLAVLLNRVGLVDINNNPYGYSDAGFSVTLTGNAPNGDIHNYQNVSNPNGGTITGIWQPDGRNASPDTVTGSTPRTALLNIFNGSLADGDWTLFIADTSEGGIGNLDSWTLQVTGNPTNGNTVPDNGNAIGLVAAGLSLLLLYRRRLLATA